MGSEQSTITLRRSTKDRLDADKPEGMTWDAYLGRLADSATAIPGTGHEDVPRPDRAGPTSEQLKTITAAIDDLPVRVGDEVVDRISQEFMG